jgi:protein phosphatase
VPQLEVDLLVRPVQPGDRYLFCTDGLTRELADADLKEMMGWTLAPEHMVRVLIELANQRGGRDNATVVLVIVGVAQ